MNYNIKNLNHWAISTEAIEWIFNNIPQNDTIVELGSGTGTIELAKYYNVFSIEENPKYINMAPSNYIYAPLVQQKTDLPATTGWYSNQNFNLLPENYSLLIVDGPTGINRINFINHINLLKTNIPILIDDTHRTPDLQLAINVANKLNATRINITGYQKNFSIILPKK